MASSSPQTSAITPASSRLQATLKVPFKKGMSYLMNSFAKTESVNFDWKLESLKRVYRFEWAAIGVLFFWSAFLLFSALR